MLATKTVDPQRFQRLGASARLQLMAARRRAVSQLEAAHRHNYPLSWAHTADANLGRPPGWLEFPGVAPGRRAARR